MPRYEKGDQFWEIEREGRQVRIRAGRVSDPGQQQTHTAHFEDEAMRDYDRRVAAKLEAGYVPIEQPKHEIRELDAELVRALVDALARPDGELARRDAWAVLGDWLTGHGDVRGELINIDETLHSLGSFEGPGARRLIARRDRLLRLWIPKWFGDFGRLDGPTKPIYMGAWDHGFIVAARVGTLPHALDLAHSRLGLRDLVPVLNTVLDSPLALLLRQLRIGELDPRSRRDLSRALPLLRTQTRSQLVRLELGGVSLGRWVRDQTGNLIQRLAFARIGSLASLALPERWAPKLEALRVVGRDLRVLPPMPCLRALELDVPLLQEELRSWVVESPWPRLERLWIRAAGLHDAWDISEGPRFEALMAALEQVALRELGIQGPTALEQLLWRAMSTPLKLDELRLFRASPAEVEMLLSGADHLDGVERFAIENGELREEWTQLKQRFGRRVVRVRQGFASTHETGDDAFDAIFDMPGFS